MRIGTLIVLVGLAGLTAAQSHAGTLALDITANPGNTGTSTTHSLGWQFQVNTPIMVDGLAFFNGGVTQGHDVGIYLDSTHTLLVSTTVLTSDPQSGTGPWLVHAITPFLLAPGTYDIAAETGADNYTSGPLSMSTIPEITFLQDRYAFGSPVLAFPSATSGTVGWFGPSFTSFDAVSTPEPASMMLVGVGLLLSGIVRRKRSSTR